MAVSVFLEQKMMKYEREIYDRERLTLSLGACPTSNRVTFSELPVSLREHGRASSCKPDTEKLTEK